MARQWIVITHPLRRRLAACAALLVGGLATLLLLTTVLANPIASLLSVIGFVVAVVSGWVALTNRGVKRNRALAAAIAGCLLLVAAVIGDDEHRFYLTLALVGLLAATSSGRVALGHPPRRPDSDVPVGRSRHPALVVNPKSGDGRAAQLGLVERARELGIHVFVWDGSDTPLQLARRAVAEGADALGMAGGDGSLAPVARLAADHGIDFVCIPAGTRNHFALDLGLDRSDPLAALTAFGPAFRRRIDLAWVNDRPFVNNVSLGLYGEIVQDEAYREDKLGTALARLPDVINENPQDLDLRYTDADGVARDDAQVVLVSNNPYTFTVGGSVGRRELDAGELGIVCLRVDGGVRAAEVVTAVLGSGNSDSMRSWTSRAFEVRSGGPVAAGLDGEALTLEPPLRFSSAPASVGVRIPPSAPGQSPAARRSSYEFAIAELLRRAVLPSRRWTSPEEFPVAG
ncbi:MAG: diacylglycerol kinase family protein [Candidatus Nanopelagicales bacterium]